MAKKTLEKKSEKVFAWTDATPEEKKAHAARRRVLAVILGWSEKSKQAVRPVPIHRESGAHYNHRLYNYAKAIACQSYGLKPEQWHGNFGQANELELQRLFNSIPTDRLNNIYYCFCNKVKDADTVEAVVKHCSIDPN